MSRWSSGILIVCLCTSVPVVHACEASEQAAVAANPDDLETRAAFARACVRAGHPTAALTHYDVLLMRDPDNVDWLLGQAQALLALKRPREALPALERARAIAPDYEDVWMANAAALGMLEEPGRSDALLAEAQGRFPQADWPAQRRRALTEERLLERGTRVSLAASYDELSGNRESWQALSFNLDHPLDDRRRLLAGVQVEERFDTRDEQIAAGFVQQFADVWTWSAAGDVAADAEVLPEWGLAAELGRALPGNRGLSLLARHASYATVDVDTVTLTIEQYFQQFRLAYALIGARPSDLDTSYSHALRIGREYGLTSQVTLAIALGEEAETVAPGVVRVTRNKSLGIAGVHWYNVKWGLAWETGWYEQGDLYDRVRIRLGLEHRF